MISWNGSHLIFNQWNHGISLFTICLLINSFLLVDFAFDIVSTTEPFLDNKSQILKGCFTADLNYDALFDVVLSSSFSSTQTGKIDKITALFSPLSGKVERVEYFAKTEPLMADFNGNLQTQFLVNSNDASLSADIVSLNSSGNSFSTIPTNYCPLSQLIPSSFLDLDGDCSAGNN